jgi:hypothetical protein
MDIIVFSTQGVRLLIPMRTLVKSIFIGGIHEDHTTI